MAQLSNLNKCCQHLLASPFMKQSFPDNKHVWKEMQKSRAYITWAAWTSLYPPMRIKARQAIH
eukprot:3210928-Amphidinium_carterae.3